MKSIMKKVISLLTAFGVTISVIPVSFAITDDEKVTLIVEVEGDAVLYSKADEARSAAAEILSVQETVRSQISSIDRKAEVGCTYTYLMNGFSVTADKSDIEKIKSLPNVKKVWVSRKYTIDDPTPVTLGEAQTIADSCCRMIGTDYMHEAGFRGEGTVVAIIDSEFDVNHEFLSAELDDPSQAALTKDDIKTLIKESKLNVSVTANRVYHNSKIPFAYNYAADNADPYTTDKRAIHGTHVAGIAAGKNGLLYDESRFDGVAPEAQLLLMSISAGGRELSEDKAVACIDDAAKLGADAVNLSFGDDYVYYDGAMSEVIAAARENGIFVSAAAGNAARSYDGEAKSIPAGLIDYSASGAPAGDKGATSVASVNDNGDNPTFYNTNQLSGDMSRFSSWGTDVSLDLKPEITTPGSIIYSSVPDDKYDIKMGTSMSAPHMTGAAALMRQFIDNAYPDYEGNKAELIENLAMSAADIIYQAEDLPYSPRQQGAGLLNMENAANTPVILHGTDGRTKLNLKEIGDTFDISFTAENLTDKPVTYDKVDLTVMTDGSETGEDGKSYIGDSVLFKHTEALPESVTVPANDSAEVSFTVSLDDEALAENAEIFTNGFFIEGFVTLSDTNDVLPEIHIPYMGFYGNWDSEPIFDAPYYSEDSIIGNTSMSAVLQGEVFKTGQNPVLEMLRRTDLRLYNMQYAEVAKYYEGEAYAGYSPNNDGEMDSVYCILSPLRTVAEWNITVTRDTTRETVFSSQASEEIPYIEKFSENDFGITEILDDGDYTVTADGILAYDKEGLLRQSVSMRFYVDTVSPRFTRYEITENDGRKYLTVSASDNRYVAGFRLCAADSKGEEKELLFPTPPSDGSKYIDITDYDEDSIKVYAYDYAMNESLYTTEPFEVTIKEAGGSTALINVLANIKNNTGRSAQATVIAALYNGEDELVKVSIEKDRTIEAGDSNLVPFVFSRLKSDIKSVKVMLWDSLEGMTPLCSAE